MFSVLLLLLQGAELYFRRTDSTANLGQYLLKNDEHLPAYLRIFNNDAMLLDNEINKGCYLLGHKGIPQYLVH